MCTFNQTNFIEMDSYCIKGIIRINEEVNKDAEHWIMLNLIVFSLFMRKFEATKDIFCAKLVFYI